MNKKTITFLTLALFFNSPIRAEEVSFQKVWKIVAQDSAFIEASRIDVQAAEVASSSAEKHWFPRVYLQAKSFVTDDPAPVFFGLLEQRSVTSADFDPGLLNHPAQQQFSQGALGMDLPIYEGGAGVKRAEQSKILARAQKFEADQALIDLYLRVASLYGKRIVLEKQKERIEGLKTEIQEVIQKYQLGSETNLLGHSGLLGLRSLQNRVKGLEGQTSTELRAVNFEFKEVGFEKEAWDIEKVEVLQFREKFLSTKESSKSARLMAAEAGATASQLNVEISRARHLPRIGGFAETTLTSGSRDTGAGYNLGVYLQWNLVTPQDWNVVREANLRAQAARLRVATLEKNVASQREILTEQTQLLTKNLSLMEESYKNLLQQSKISYQLFKNGALSALQLAEIMNRRADLIVQESENENGLLQASMQLLASTQSLMPAILNPEVEK